MKQSLQRVLALLLSLALCVGLTPVTALATEPGAGPETPDGAALPAVEAEAPPPALALPELDEPAPEAEPQRILNPASPKLRVTGLDGADVTENCAVVWTDGGSHVLTPPVVVEAGTTVRYTVSPGAALERGGVQYYAETGGSVVLTELEQPVDVALEQRGSVSLRVVDRKTGAELPFDREQGWSVTWQIGRSRIGTEATSPLRAPGTELDAYVSLSGESYERYRAVQNPVGTYPVSFGNRVETVELDRKVPELSMTAYERPISRNDNMVVYRTDNGYTFESITADGAPVVIGEDTIDFGSTEMNFNSRFLASLGLGEHVFVFHYAETTAEDNYDTTLTMTQTVGDIGEVRWRQSYRSSWSSFDKETYTGAPITKKPILYVGDWANDKREGMLREGVDYTVSYENNVLVSTDGNKARMILTGIGNYAGSSRILEFTIQPCNITQDSTTWFEVIPNFDWPILYDGQEHDLTDVTVKANGVELVKGRDYTVSYHNSGVGSWSPDDNHVVGAKGLPVGSAAASQSFPILITGIGNYTGSWTSRSNGSGALDGYAVEMQYRIMPHVAETVGGGLVVNGIPWTWQLDPDGLLTIHGSGEMPEGFHSAYWVGGDDPYIRGWWYDYREMIKRVVITGDVTGIEGNAFWDCTNLVEATIPDTVEILRTMAFYSCRSLRTVHAPGTKYLPSRLQTIQNGAFGGNVYNLRIWMPDNVTTVEVNNLGENKLVSCRRGTTTEATLKATGSQYQVEGYEGYYVEGGDNYSLGGGYTVYRYVGPGGDMVLPDFLDSVTHYDMFSAAASRVTRLVIPGNIRLLNGDAFRFLGNCAEIVIEPGEMTTLIRGLLNEHGDTVLTIPDTVTEMPDGDFSYFYSSLTVVVGEGSAAHRWAVAHGYIPDDGSGVGRMYRLRKNSQPYVTPLSASVPGDAPTDVTVTKHDGDYSFSALRCNGTALKQNTDYTRSGDTVKVKAAYLASLGVGTHVFTLHYTGLAGEHGDIPAIDPSFRITVLHTCRPALTVTGQDGADVTADCAVVWKSGGKTLSAPVSVPAGTTLSYTVTPGDALQRGGVQYYAVAQGSVTLTEDGQRVAVALPPLGTVTVTPTGNGAALPAEEYTVKWYTRADGRDTQVGTGGTSPLTDADTTLYYDLILSGESGADWQGVEKAAVSVVFGNTPLEVELRPSSTAYPVRFYLNGGTEREPGSCDTQYIVRNHALILPAAPVRRGWVFQGWTADYDGALRQPGETVTVKQGVYFYALWTEMTPLRVSFAGLGLLAGSVTLYGVTDAGEELSVWSAYRFGGSDAWEQEPVTLANAYRNDNTLVSLVLRGEVDGQRVELARYDEPNGDLYEAEGTLTLTKTGLWQAVTEVRAEGLEAGTDHSVVDKVYRDPALPRNDYARLPFLTDGGTAYYVRFSGVPGSAAYTGYDWTAVYPLARTGSVLHAAVTAIAPSRWTGTVTYGAEKTPAANAAVTVSQRAYGLDRSYSAVTDAAGRFTVEGFPETAATVSVNWGGREAYSKGFSALSNGMELNLNSVRVQWELDFDGVYDPALRERLVAWSKWSRPSIRFTSGEAVKSWSTALSDFQTQALYNVALDGLDWDVSGGYIEPASGTVTLTDGAGAVTATLKLRAGVLARVNADVSCSAVLGWFDADGGFVGFSDGGLGLYGGDDRDWLCVCPEETGGSYTVALMPANVRLDAGEALANVPESWLFHIWPDVRLGKNQVVELERVRLTAEMNDNARYVTLPASTLSADRESFADVSELVTFSGSIGLDAQMRSGLLNQIYLCSEEPGRRGAPSMKLEAMVIDGQTYGADAFALGHGTYAISFSGAAIPLPCNYTLYCRPVDPGMNINFTMQVGGSCVYGAGHSVNFYRELVGTGTVYRPGAVIRSLSNHVCSDTVTVKGTALRYETVRIYDGEALIGTATANNAGEWSAAVPLPNTDPQVMSVHRLHSETASGAVSEDLLICHDPKGPELKRFTMSWGGDSWGKEIDVGSAYTTGSTGSMRDVTFRATFEHPEKLASLGGDVRVMFKYYRYNGEVGFLDAAWDEAQGVFTATIPGYRNSAIFAAEAIYRPIVTGRGIDSEWNTNADFFYDPDFRPETDFTLDADLRENYLEGLERLTQAAEGQHSAADSYTVRFDADGTASLSGSLPAGESLSQYTAAARTLLADGTHMARAGVRYGTPTGALQWLLDAAETWRTEKPEEAQIGKFAHVTLYPDRASLRAALTGLADIADRQVSLRAAYDGGTAQYDSYIFTDAETEGNDRLLGGTYFISVLALTDEAQGVWMLSTGLVFTEAFTAYAAPLESAAQRQSETAELLYELEIGHLPDWYNWAWDAADSLSSAISAGLGLANGIADAAKAVPRLSKLAGQGSGAMAAVNQFTSTINYIAASDKQALSQGDQINKVKNSPCYKKAMQWLYEQGMDDPNFDDGGLYDDQCRLIDAIRDVDFSGDLTGMEKANFYVNSACNAVAMYAAAGGPVSWGVGLAVTAGGMLFGKYAESCAADEKAAREFLFRQFMANSNDIINKYAKEHPDDPDCQGHKKLAFTQQPPTMKVCYDPSGVVYEGVLENPVAGAAVTLYYAVDADGNPVREELAGNASALLPADAVRDLVPAAATQTTGEDGRYAWFVPEGLWYVGVEKAGYARGSSNADAAATVGAYVDGKYTRLLPVLPVQLDVNIPLIDRSAPYVEAERYTAEGVYVTYSKYMDERDILRASNYSLSVRPGGDGEANPADFTVESVEWGHAPSNIDSGETAYTRTVLLRVRALAPGDVVHWSVDGSVRSYAATALGETFRSSGTVEPQETLDAPTVYVDGAAVADGETVWVRRGALLELRLPTSAADIASAGISWSRDGTVWEPYTGAISLENNLDLTARTEALGYQTSDSASASFVLTRTLRFCVAGGVTTSDGGDAEGLPLRLTGAGYSKTISVIQNGFAWFDLPPGDYTITFAGSEDYAPLSQRVSVTDENQVLSLRLQARPPQLDAARSGAALDYSIRRLPPESRLIVARYEDGRMTELEIIDKPQPADTLTLPDGGGDYKLFLVDKENRPLCAAWESGQ